MNLKTKIITWTEARKVVAKLNPTLSQIIDDIPNAGTLPLIKAQFPYMSPMTIKGDFFFPIDGVLKLHHDTSVPIEIRDLLQYPWRGCPTGIVTHNAFEVFTQSFTHTIPFRMVEPGSIYATLGLFDSKIPGHYLQSAYSLTAGCESLILLPKVSDKNKNDLLYKHLKLSNKDQKLYPKTSAEQTALLKKLAFSPKFNSQWYVETLIFSKYFFEKTPGTLPFQHHLLTNIHSSTCYERYRYLYEILWASFVEKSILPRFGSLYKKSASSVLAVAKHIINISLGQNITTPGFTPAIDDITGPVSSLIDLYIDVYKIRFFHPTFMRVANYNGTAPVYYSMQRHAFFHPEAKLANLHQTINELELIREIIYRFQEKIIRNNASLEYDVSDTILLDVLQKTQFDFFHPQADNKGGVISNIESIFEEDDRFRQVHRLTSEPQLQHPIKSTFFKGCIRIRPNKGEGIL